ncbi:MAG: hypothetical protein IKL86_01475 [Clostridia bacterium]|nr:hypothetical protein [Clostridia bacterium]
MSTHEHPLTEGAIVKENVIVPDYAGEGCEEHYDERVIKQDKSYDTMQKIGSINPYLRAMIIGEALNIPRCKKPFFKK